MHSFEVMLMCDVCDFGEADDDVLMMRDKHGGMVPSWLPTLPMRALQKVRGCQSRPEELAETLHVREIPCIIP